MMFKNEYSWLSNFHPCNIEYEGVIYPTLEHCYQACKSFNPSERIAISQLLTPGKAKRHKTQFPVLDFHTFKVDLMYKLLTLKFRDDELRTLLVSTGDLFIEESNTWGDQFWGVCNGVGDNILGNLIMRVRNDINRLEK